MRIFGFDIRMMKTAWNQQKSKLCLKCCFVILGEDVKLLKHKDPPHQQISWRTNHHGLSNQPR